MINQQSPAKLCCLRINGRFSLRSHLFALHVRLKSAYLDAHRMHLYRTYMSNRFFTSAISFGMHRRWDRQRITVWKHPPLLSHALVENYPLADAESRSRPSFSRRLFIACSRRAIQLSHLSTRRWHSVQVHAVCSDSQLLI